MFPVCMSSWLSVWLAGRLACKYLTYSKWWKLFFLFVLFAHSLIIFLFLYLISVLGKDIQRKCIQKLMEECLELGVFTVTLVFVFVLALLLIHLADNWKKHIGNRNSDHCDSNNDDDDDDLAKRKPKLASLVDCHPPSRAVCKTSNP